MTVYAIAQLRFTDRDAYDRYQRRFLEVFRRYAGKPPGQPTRSADHREAGR